MHEIIAKIIILHYQLVLWEICIIVLYICMCYSEGYWLLRRYLILRQLIMFTYIRGGVCTYVCMYTQQPYTYFSVFSLAGNCNSCLISIVSICSCKYGSLVDFVFCRIALDFCPITHNEAL